MLSICTIVAHYLPGFKAGGPIQSIANLLSCLGNSFDFTILTSDRDYLESKPYPSIKVNEYVKLSNGTVYYLPPKLFKASFLCSLINRSIYDILYLNSFFSLQISILPLILFKFKKLHVRKVIIAPRGEFSKGALAIKSFKKRIYIYLSRITGLYKDVLFQASSNYESEDIINALGKQVQIRIAPNIVFAEKLIKIEQSRKKSRGVLSMCFLSRITFKKNLHGALKIINSLPINQYSNNHQAIIFDIYGTLEDPNYWRTCEKICNKLPPNVVASYKGIVKKADVLITLSNYDLFFFPTFGENFGHVIFEALLSGCPILISDQTPWRNCSEEGIGWEFPLSKNELFMATIMKCLNMNEIEHSILRKKANAYAATYAKCQQNIELNKGLFINL